MIHELGEDISQQNAVFFKQIDEQLDSSKRASLESMALLTKLSVIGFITHQILQRGTEKQPNYNGMRSVLLSLTRIC